MSDNVLKILDFTKYPGPRYKHLGPDSGEEFRDTYLSKAVDKSGADLIVDLDGAFGYGSSFLEESFGGLVRKGYSIEVIRSIVEKLKTDEDPSLKFEIQTYVEDAIAVKQASTIQQQDAI